MKTVLWPNHIFPVVFPYLVCSFIGNNVFAIPSNLTNLFYYNDLATWDEAYSTCVRSGAYLVHIEDADKQTVVMETYQQFSTQSGGHVWLGEIKPSFNDTTFVRTDTCLKSTWNNWADGHPTLEPLEMCVRADVTTSKWESVFCHSLATVMCEQKTDKPCLYTPYPNTTITDVGTNIFTDTIDTTEDFTVHCQQLCNERVNAGIEECWAASYVTEINGHNLCKLHFGSNKATVQDNTLWITTVNATLYLKGCHEGVLARPAKGDNSREDWNEFDCETGTFSWQPMGECECPCEPMTEEESRIFMENILSSLTINISNLSSVRRKYYSAVEDNVVALGLGYSGAVFLALSALLIVLCDVDVLIRGRKHVFEN